MAVISIQDLAVSGLEATYGAANSGGDTFANDGKTLFHAKNGSGGDITITFAAASASVQKAGYGSVSISNTAVVVTAGEERLIGFFPTKRFNNSSGQVAVSYSGVSSLTVAAIRCPRPE